MLAHYRITDKLGAGGMGEVYRARDEQLDRDVAIKVLPASSFEDPVARARLLQEARAAAALNHPHICTVHEVGEADGQTYIAMELVDGQPLSERLRAGSLHADQVMRYGLQLADALAHAHERGVVHRDLKSANIIVRPDGRLKVLDFGLAKRLTANELTVAITQDVTALTQPGTVMGTVAYMAPEQLRGEPAQTHSDIWALGVVFHEMAAGGRPFRGQTGFELSAAILSEAPAALPSSVPRPLQTVIARCLEKQPAQRYQAGGAVHAALEALHEARTDTYAPKVSSEAPTVVESLPKPSASDPVTVTLSRRSVIRVGLGVAVALLVGLTSWQFWPDVNRRSLAVLPFENVLDDPDTDYLSDGIAESLIRQVSSLSSVRVTPLGITLDFKGQPIAPGDAGRRLGVETVLAGALSLESGRLKITTELVDVESGARLWTGTFDRDASELLEVQDEIASAILDDGLRLQLSEDEQLELARGPTVDGEAYDLYLQARYLQRRATENDYLEAIELLESATVRDPGFAQAYLLLAGTYMALGIDGFMRPTDAWAQADRHARRALEADHDSPDARAIQHALAFFYDWDWEGAERERTLALQTPVGEFDPDHLRSFSLALLALGRTEEALDLASRTRELDPLSIGLAMLEADYLVRADQLDAAVAVYERTIEVDPESADAYFGLAEAFLRQRRFDEANEARRQAHDILGDDPIAELFATAGGEEGYLLADEADLRRQLEFMEAREAWGYVSPLSFAQVYAQLGDADQAFAYLEEAFTQRSPGLALLTVDQAFYRVRDDPRFEDALRQVGFPQVE